MKFAGMVYDGAQTICAKYHHFVLSLKEVIDVIREASVFLLRKLISLKWSENSSSLHCRHSQECPFLSFHHCIIMSTAMGISTLWLLLQNIKFSMGGRKGNKKAEFKVAFLLKLQSRECPRNKHPMHNSWTIAFLNQPIVEKKGTEKNEFKVSEGSQFILCTCKLKQMPQEHMFPALLQC